MNIKWFKFSNRLLPKSRNRTGILPELLFTLVYIICGLHSGMAMVHMAHWPDWRSPVATAFSLGLMVLWVVHQLTSTRDQNVSRWQAAMAEFARRFGYSYVFIALTALLFAVVSGDPNGDYLHTFWWRFAGAKIVASDELHAVWLGLIVLGEALSVGWLFRGILAARRCLQRLPA